MTQKGLVRGLAASLMGACFFAGLSIATSVAMLARVEPTLVSPHGLLIRGAPDMLVWITFALIAMALALVSLVLVKKVTDAEAVKRDFGVVAKILWVLVFLNGFLAIATIFLALFSLGIEGMGERAATALQRRYWLGTFVPVLLAAAVNAVGAYFLRTIAGGKMLMMNIFKKVNLSVAIAATVLMVIASLYALHGRESSSSGSTNQNWEWILRGRGF